MSKLLAVDLDPEVAALLTAKPGVTDDLRISALMRCGFQILWDPSLARDYVRLGSPVALAKPSPAGVNWYLTRARNTDGDVALVPSQAHDFFTGLLTALRGEKLDPKECVEKLYYISQTARLTRMHIAAIESIVRLGGTGKHVLDFLAAGDA